MPVTVLLHFKKLHIFPYFPIADTYYGNIIGTFNVNHFSYIIDYRKLFVL